MRRKLAAVALLVGVCLGAVVTRAVWEGRRALARGDRAHRAHDEREAIAGWRRAARWYVPGAPHVGAAYDRLEALAADAERRGDTATALDAWRGVRGSILATRSFYVPQERRLEPANRHIAALMARTDESPLEAAGGVEQREAWHYALLARDEAPSVGWSVIALCGLATWIGGGVLFALRGVSARDELQPRWAAWSGVMVAVGLVVWMLGLYKA